MSTFEQRKPFYKDSDIVPVVNITSECNDLNGNYLIAPMPKEFLNLRESLKEVPAPLEKRILNFYNPETEEYSLPYLKNPIDYIKIQGIYVKNASLASIALDDNPWLYNIADFEENQLFIQVVD